MTLLRAGVDRTVIALWLGHESAETTRMYLHADMRMKEQALARTTESGLAPARFSPDDDLLAFLEDLRICRAVAPPKHDVSTARDWTRHNQARGIVAVMPRAA